MADWWGNPSPVDTSDIDEKIYRRVMEIMRKPVEVVDQDAIDPGSIINGGTGWPALRREIKW